MTQQAETPFMNRTIDVLDDATRHEHAHAVCRESWRADGECTPCHRVQAMDRIHRIGQARPVRVVRYATKYTVEQRMIELQEAKRAPRRALAKGALAKLSEQELKRARLQAGPLPPL